MADATGFFDANTAGRREFVDALANATLLQYDTKANLDTITDLLGMMGFRTDEHTLVRNSGSAMVPLELIETGVDASKPAGAAANNGRMFWATDSKILYYVEGGVQYKIGTTEHDELTAGSIGVDDHHNKVHDHSSAGEGGDSVDISDITNSAIGFRSYFRNTSGIAIDTVTPEDAMQTVPSVPSIAANKGFWARYFITYDGPAGDDLRFSMVVPAGATAVLATVGVTPGGTLTQLSGATIDLDTIAVGSSRHVVINVVGLIGGTTGTAISLQVRKIVDAGADCNILVESQGEIIYLQ